jgi:hypothetical protein
LLLSLGFSCQILYVAIFLVSFDKVTKNSPILSSVKFCPHCAMELVIWLKC